MTTIYRITAPDGGNAHERGIAALLGRAGSKWPSHGLMPCTVSCQKIVKDVTGKLLFTELSAVSVWVNAATKRDDGRKSSAHRVMCRCPGCDRVMSAGRLFQHKCTGK